MLHPGRLIQPASETSRSLMIIGSPGAHVVCSTAALAASHVLGLIGFPSGPKTGGRRASTLVPGHRSRDGMKKYELRCGM
jgi:hypothetical protein